MTEGPDSPDQGDREEAPRETARDEAPTSSGLLAAGEMHTRAEEFLTRREVPDEMRGTQHAPRRVEIRHREGSYSIHFGDRTIASFCQEFSEITGYALPTNARQQVYIRIDHIGEIRGWRGDGDDEPPQTGRERIDQAAQQARPVERAESVLRASMARPEPSEDWRREVYERLHREIGQCSDMLALLERL